MEIRTWVHIGIAVLQSIVALGNAGRDDMDSARFNMLGAIVWVATI